MALINAALSYFLSSLKAASFMISRLLHHLWSWTQGKQSHIHSLTLCASSPDGSLHNRMLMPQPNKFQSLASQSAMTSYADGRPGRRCVVSVSESRSRNLALRQLGISSRTPPQYEGDSSSLPYRKESALLRSFDLSQFRRSVTKQTRRQRME